MSERGVSVDHSTIYRWVQTCAPEMERRLRWHWRRPGSQSWRGRDSIKRFLGKALKGLKDWEQPTVINTDKAPTYAAALAELKAEGKCPTDTQHRQAKYLNNVVEADHGKLKQLIRPVRGFKTLKTAYATIKGFELMRGSAQGSGGDLQHHPRHPRRSPSCRARLRAWRVRVGGDHACCQRAAQSRSRLRTERKDVIRRHHAPRAEFATEPIGGCLPA